jgi:hypothetical protein
MSDEERDEHNGPEEGESEHEWIQRLGSPELRMLHLLEKLSRRVDENDEGARHRAEEVQRKMDFIVEQQAQFAVDIRKLGASQTRTDEIVQRLANATLRNFEKVEGEVSNLDRKMEALVDSHIRMADTHKEVEERLNAFIATVERLINGRRNGGRKEPGGADE